MPKAGNLLRILMVDDNPLDRELVGELLGGHEDVLFRCAEDLASGRATAGEGFDVVLLDHNLPDGHGSDAVPAFRRLAPEAIVVGLCSEGADDVVSAFLAAGADRVENKMTLMGPDLADRVRSIRGVRA